MGLNSGLVDLLVSIWITCCSLSLTPPSSNSPLLGNNGGALLHIVISTEEVIQRDPTVSDRPGPVDPFALAGSLKALITRTGDLFFFAARLAIQDLDKDLKGDRDDMRRSTKVCHTPSA